MARWAITQKEAWRATVRWAITLTEVWPALVRAYAVRTARPRLVRARRTDRMVVPARGKLPCAFGTYRTREAGTRTTSYT